MIEDDIDVTVVCYLTCKETASLVTSIATYNVIRSEEVLIKKDEEPLFCFHGFIFGAPQGP